MERKKASEAENGSQALTASKSPKDVSGTGKARKNGGWQEIEARREKAALKESLADVWDEDFDLDEEILAELDHKAEFFTPQDETEEEVFDGDEDVDEFFDDDPA